MKFVFFGECMLESRADSAAQAPFTFGGDTLNSALYLARLLTPMHQIYYATGVGEDSISEQLIECWQAEGVETELVTKVQGKTLGRYGINTNELGERSFSYQRDNSAAKFYFAKRPHQTSTNVTEPLTNFLLHDSADYFYFSGISLAILSAQDCDYLFTLLAKFKRRGGRVIFDNNYRPVLWQGRSPLPYYQQAMALADIAFLTDDDEYSLYGGHSVESIISRYQHNAQFNRQELVIKQGAKPCVIKAAQQQTSFKIPLIHVDCPRLPSEKIIDTSAAGDSFSAGYLAKRLTGKGIEASAVFAHQLAGRVIQFSGAIIEKSEMLDLIADAQ